jgi:hypothetical protein
MAIVQISQIQQRSGNLVDLPQLNEAEFGFASDTNQLFIGKTNPIQNIEVLTSYSNIAFNQIVGANGNLNITASSLSTGEVLAFDGTNWINAGGNAGGLINLGNVSNVQIGGGAIGYVLQTDGTGNLSWTPKTVSTAFLQDITKSTNAVFTTTQDNFFTKGAAVTITNVPGMTQLNGNVYYVVPLTSNTFSLSDSSANAANSANLLNTSSYTAFPYSAVSTTYAGNSGILLANSIPFSTGESIQFIGTTFGGIRANTTYYILTNSANVITVSLTPGGNTVGLTTANGTANVYATGGRAISSISGSGSGTQAGGTNGTVQINSNGVLYGDSNLIYSSSNLSVTGNIIASATVNAVSVTSTNLQGTLVSASNAQPNITSVGTLTSLAVTGNITSGNANLGNLASANYFTGTLTTNAQPNITSVGTLTSLTVTGNISGANLIGNHYGNGAALSSLTGANVTGQVGNALLAGTVYTNAQPNITSVGTLSSLTVTGNIASGNANLGNLATANYFSGNYSGNGANLSSITGANVTGQVGNALVAGTVYTNAQPNITSVGTLSSLTVTNKVTAGQLQGDGGNLSNIQGANVSGTVSSASSATSATSATTAGTVTTAAQPNITSVGTLANLTVNASTGFVQTPVLTTGANTTAGTITGNFSLSTGSKLNATYADLGEYYAADSLYEPGTVLMFGGSNEVTIADDATNKVAGVVSTNPAYVMNSDINCEYPIVLALQGRVPCKVRGNIKKGDMLISGGSGYARPSNSPLMGTVIGKALADFNGIEGIIEIAVSRL